MLYHFIVHMRPDFTQSIRNPPSCSQYVYSLCYATVQVGVLDRHLAVGCPAALHIILPLSVPVYKVVPTEPARFSTNYPSHMPADHEFLPHSVNARVTNDGPNTEHCLSNNIFAAAIDDYLADDGGESESEKEESDGGDIENEVGGLAGKPDGNDNDNGQEEMGEQ
ncbi:hypothetical protein BT96DRAFT_992225 [Gymnopus androsaceus JB14]|uniref:Uncharacterized protein n=1 Tax=Gymnopus androsaceus JB14 TaxID=1447944 RepID=A0A6A4HTS1_9AGAR|nr:hypothetical protein BT96DRAFT_992225 [Gymnopus androsaceus JB14]